MKFSFVQMLLWFLVQSFLHSSCVSEDDSLVVATSLGSLRGKLQAVIGGHSVRQFLGIPFAQPPVGPLRFSRPKPVHPWNQIRDAVEFGPICPQTSLLSAFGMPDADKKTIAVPQDEDCLTLNVYTPSSAKGDDKLAVMVWIHGGGFMFGSARTYNPSLLVALYNVIVVTINYRIGVLGFFNIPGTDIKGNFGMYDQIEALKWVQKNIASFGGNPNQVTIFGESAGGMSVSSHLLSPVSKGLFHRAIAQSGTSVGPYSCLKVTNTDALEVFSKILNCDDKGDKLVECLRDKSVENVLAAQVNVSNPMETRGFLSTVVIDGEFLPDDPESLLRQGKVNHADVITGVTGNEGGFVVFMFQEKEFTVDTFKTAVKRDLSMVGMHTQLVEDAVLFEYLPHDDLKDSDKIRQAAMDVNSDHMFLASAVMEAKLFTRAGNRVYMYVFDHSSHLPRHSALLGAHHGLDLAFTFGLPLSKDTFSDDIKWLLPGNYSTLEQGLSKYVMEIWTNFAKHGDPNGLDSMPVKWPVYNNTEHAYLSISMEPKVKHRLRERKVAFWNDFIPKLSGVNKETPEGKEKPSKSHKEEL